MSDPIARNPHFFLVGCPRSGTTMLQRMLDHHPELTVANDTHFIARALQNPEPGIDPPLTPQLVEQVRTYHRFHRLGLPDRDVDAAASRAVTYGEFVSALYDALGRLDGKPLAGEKTPDYCRHLPFLHALFPQARTVHIIRDGRDVALSMLQWAREGKGPGKLELWREHPVAVCALWWWWNVATGRRDGAALGPEAYREVVYEQLVDRPEPTLRSLADFLGIRFSGQMLKYHESRTRTDVHISPRSSARLPPTANLRNWRSQMSEHDLALFEAISGDLLEATGYERGAGSIPTGIQTTADRCCRWWELKEGPMPSIEQLQHR